MHSSLEINSCSPFNKVSVNLEYRVSPNLSIFVRIHRVLINDDKYFPPLLSRPPSKFLQHPRSDRILNRQVVRDFVTQWIGVVREIRILLPIARLCVEISAKLERKVRTGNISSFSTS